MIDAPALLQPHVRRQLVTLVSELQAVDPRPIWSAERESGMASGVDEVFHFLFDDNDLDEGAVGVTLRSEPEVRVIEALKRALEIVMDAVGDADDNAFVSHPLWADVRQAAEAAGAELAANPNGRFPP